MAAPTSTLRVHQQDQALTFQVEGWGTMALSLPIRRYAEQAIARGLTSLRLDLRRCTYMDSTFLGTLLFLKRAVERQRQGAFTLVSPSPQCGELLHSMHVDKLFCTETADEPAAAVWTELSSDGLDIPTAKGNVLQAHQELASLAGTAGEPFRAVVRCLDETSDTNPPRSKRTEF
jgi:anti-sigma B factor antagonist